MKGLNFKFRGTSQSNFLLQQAIAISKEKPTKDAKFLVNFLKTHSLFGGAMTTSTEKFGLGLGATYQDESFISDFDLDIGGQTGRDAGTHPTLPAYTRVDVMAYYDISEQFRLQLNIENLTDETYFPNAHSTHQATVGAPLNARFTISGRF